MKIRKPLYTTIICISPFLSGCLGGGDDTPTEPPPEPSVITWDKLIWDDGSNDPNTLWED